ncbi:MAG: hypothetical protein KDD25_00025 [Bdellovibrionales bacterium]|nr:hypothetical protein [Bdellovibrionales bacterium]
MKLLVLLGFLLQTPSHSFGDCSSPSGKIGEFQFYNKSYIVCDGAYWVKINVSTYPSPCSVADNGKIVYQSNYLEYCSDEKGSYQWARIYGTTLGSCTVAEVGKFKYDSTLRNPQYCRFNGLGYTWTSMREDRQIRLTTTDIDPAFGGLAGGDAICQAQAVANGKGGTWVAWLSTSTVDAKDRILDNGPWYNQGTKIADDKADLIDGTLDGSIQFMFAGGSTTTNRWTGTTSTGLNSGNNCLDWTYNSGVSRGDPSGTQGDTSATSTWTQLGLLTCSTITRKLICFEL